MHANYTVNAWGHKSAQPHWVLMEEHVAKKSCRVTNWWAGVFASQYIIHKSSLSKVVSVATCTAKCQSIVEDSLPCLAFQTLTTVIKFKETVIIDCTLCGL